MDNAAALIWIGVIVGLLLGGFVGMRIATAKRNTRLRTWFIRYEYTDHNGEHHKAWAIREDTLEGVTRYIIKFDDGLKNFFLTDIKEIT